METCKCKKKNGDQCTRIASSKQGQNHEYCWQHQHCDQSIIPIVPPTVKSPDKIKTKEATNGPILNDNSSIGDFKNLLRHILKIQELYKLHEVNDQHDKLFININKVVNNISITAFKNIAIKLDIYDILNKNWLHKLHTLYDEFDEKSTVKYGEKRYYFTELMQYISWNELVRYYKAEQTEPSDLISMGSIVKPSTYSTNAIKLLVQYKYILQKINTSESKINKLIYNLVTLAPNAARDINGSEESNELDILKVMFISVNIYDPFTFEGDD